MATTVNQNLLKAFIIKNAGVQINQEQARKLKISDKDFAEANTDNDKRLEIDEILQDEDLYAQFATMYVEEQEKKQSVKDKEKQKEEQTQVKNKNEAGV